jgi:hypothetical protein
MIGRGAAFLLVLGALPAGFGGSSDPALASEPSPRERVAKVACYAPAPGFGVRRVSRCSRIEKIRPVRKGVWWVQLRRPPVYCYVVHLGGSGGDGRNDVPGVGYVDEVRCPASAYADEGKPDLRVTMRGFTSESRHRKYGLVSLTAVGPGRTRVVVEANGDVALLSFAACGELSSRRSHQLSQFYSFRSTTLVRLSLQELTATPHSVIFDSGGAHGGVPIGCADLVPSG